MSGCVECDFCSEQISAEEEGLYSCYMCGYGKHKDDSSTRQNICDECAMKHECSRCSGQCCPKCAMNTFNCCGDSIIICGSYCPTYINDDSEESCARGHITKMLSCGHIGCNYYTLGCLTCKRIGNKKKLTCSDYNGMGRIILNVNEEKGGDEEIISDDCYDSTDDEEREGPIENDSSVKADSFTNAIQLSKPKTCIEIEDSNVSIEDSEEDDDYDDDSEGDCGSGGEVIAVYTSTKNNTESENVSTKRKADDEDALMHDKVLVEDIMDMVQTDSLKTHLMEWLNSTSKKRKIL